MITQSMDFNAPEIDYTANTVLYYRITQYGYFLYTNHLTVYQLLSVCTNSPQGCQFLIWNRSSHVCGEHHSNFIWKKNLS